MRKVVVIVAVVVAAVAAAAYFGLFSQERTAAAQGRGQQGQGGGGGGFGGPFGGGGGGGFRPPMTVETGKVGRGDVSAHLLVVGNLIGQATVDVAPKTGGRLSSVNVKLGDRVRAGQLIAKIEDRELVEQVKQSEAALLVAQATIRQREADLALALSNVERSRNLYKRELLPKQTLDDAEAQHLAAMAQTDLARAQLVQNQSRLEELKFNLGDTSIVSPIDGFIGKRNVDPGAWVAQQVPVVSVVAISSLRLVVNIVERDLRLVSAGDPASVEVDAYPGEKFPGRIGRIAPVLDPATRTAEMEVEVPNGDFRLKPGMYARINLIVEERKGTLVVPKEAVVDYENKRGVFVANEERKAAFVPVTIGLEEEDRVEITAGVKEGDTIIVLGAGALRNGDQLVMAGDPAQPGADGPGPGQGPGRGGRQRPQGQGR
jgi:RND family efflux transporter MFP subunit